MRLADPRMLGPHSAHHHPIVKKMAVQTDHGVPLSTLCPKFLHTNSTSHTWPFSAIAELIDNAYDPDVSAKQFWIDKTVVKEKECLSFMDNGNGLDHERMHKMLSFGYSDKIAMNGQEPIGIYGNGFKSGSMRLGKDAIVFSKSKRTSCVGMLSQTYLEKIGAKQIIVPIVSCEERDTNKFSVREEQKASLQAILQFSPFKTQEELLTEIDAISLPGSTENTGTRIIIWNLRSTSTGTTEFDFETDRYDIRIPSDVYNTVDDTRPDKVTSHIPESVYSLRAFCSILYLKPRMQVIIRGQKVKSQLIAKSLAWSRKDHYKPNFLNKRITITFGYNTKSKDQCGIMMYHKNRLIKAYERVGCQLKANNSGVGVIGVIECNFLEPTHNKQSFLENDKYRKTITNLGIKLEEYCKEIRFRETNNINSTTLLEDIKKRPDQNWVQCDRCLQWRKLPDCYDVNKLPDKWYCRLNPDPQFRSCQVPEEPEDSDDDQPSYRKTYKQQEREEKMKQEKRRQKVRSHEEQLRLSKLAEQNEVLRRQQKDLERQLRQKTAQPPSTPTPLRSWSSQRGAARPESSPQTSSTISQAACSPSSNDGLPVITSVCSLSAGSLSRDPLRKKRTQPLIPQRTPKKPRLNGFHRSTSEAGSSVDVTPQRSPSVNVHNNDDDDTDDDTDDDIVILETASTPKPKKTLVDFRKVKREEEQSDTNVSMLLECSDDAAVDIPTETNAAGASSAGSAAVDTSSTPLPHPELSSATTQTEIPKVKQEDESRNQDDDDNNNDKSGEEQSSDMNACNVQQRVFKQESSGSAHMENQGQQTLQNGGNHDLQSEENPGPSCSNAGDSKYLPLTYPTISEVQKQQDQLLELMQDTAQERDSLKEQVQKLTSQLTDLEKELQEMAQVSIKKECSHQASQTEETGGQKDYKSLFEKVKQKINELIKDKEALIAVSETEANLSADQNVENDDDDKIALKVDALVRKLNQRTMEKNELRSRLDFMEDENANLAAQCEELRLSLEHQREHAASHQTASDSIQTHPVEEGGVADSGAHSSSDASRSLMELRQNVSRLLLFYVPALDLAQVNYECNVIDEILEQVLSNMDSDTPVGMISEASNN